MAISHLTRRTSKRLGQLLIDAGLITKEQLDEALAQYKQTGGKLGELLVAKGYVTEQDVAVAIASQFNVPYIDASSYVVDPEIATIFSVDFMRENGFAALDKFGSILLIAVASPLSPGVFGQIEKDSGCTLQCMVTSSSSLDALYPKLQEIQKKEGVTEGAKPAVSPKAEGEAAPLPKGQGDGADEEWASLLETVADAEFLKELEQTMDKLEFKPGRSDDEDEE